MLLIVLLLISCSLNSSNEPTSTVVSVEHHGAMAARASSLSEDELCDAALEAFMKKTDSDLARYVKPHLASAIKEVTSSPESDSDNDTPSPRKVIRSWVRQPDCIKTTSRPQLDEVILSAVQRAFEEREVSLAKKSEKIEGMFSKKATTLIATVVGAIVTVASSLGSVYGTMNNSGNCTK